MEQITPTKAIEALRNQLADVEGNIAKVIDWPRFALDQDAAAVVAADQAAMERKRDLLKAALDAATQQQAREAAASNAERVAALTAIAREKVEALLKEREQLGQQLSTAVADVGRLLRELHDQARRVRQCWPSEALAVTGGFGMGLRELDTEDLHNVISQWLAWSLGAPLWPEQRDPLHRDTSVERSIRWEVTAVRKGFERGVQAARPTLQVPE